MCACVWVRVCTRVGVCGHARVHVYGFVCACSWCVCMCVCACVGACLYIHGACAHVCACSWCVCAHVCTCWCVGCVCTCMAICMHARVCAHFMVHVCKCMGVCVCMCICANIWMFVCVLEGGIRASVSGLGRGGWRVACAHRAGPDPVSASPVCGSPQGALGSASSLFSAARGGRWARRLCLPDSICTQERGPGRVPAGHVPRRPRLPSHCLTGLLGKDVNPALVTWGTGGGSGRGAWR